MGPTALALGVALALAAGFALAWWLRGRQAGTEIAAQVAGMQSERERAEQARDYSQQRLQETQAAERERAARLETLTQQHEALQREHSALQSTARARSERLQEIVAERDRLAGEGAELRERVARLESDLRTQRAEFEEQRKGLNEKLALLQDSEKKLSEQFENIANRIFESKSESFRKTSADQLQNLLKPFREQLDGLHKDVREASKERFTLGEQIKNIVTETSALTTALKGDTKQQGDWGEVVLERILESSGLRKGEEYEVQSSFTDDQGNRLRPDVILHLPEDRDIVIDSKVSLTAYERYVNGEDEAGREAQLKAHVQSVRRHMESLAGKRYEHIESIRSLDYVLMWLPIEPAYFAAMQADPSLMNLAMEKRVIPVCATTLFAVLKTVERVWRYERQNNNVQAIINRASQLYDKFRTFTEALSAIGTHLDRAQTSYHQARNRLTEGPGNVVRQIEMLREMGVTPKKPLSSDWADNAADSLDAPENDGEERA